MESEHGSTGSSVISAGELSTRRLTDSQKGFKEVILSWKNLNVRVVKKGPRSFWKRSRSEELQILNNVSGYAKSGSLLAIMGASGAGKTTLLAAISQRLLTVSSGQVLVNGNLVSKQFMTSISGFVPQHDLAFQTLTLSEHMEFMAKLKMDHRVRRFHRKRRIHSLLTELGLSKCASTRLADLSGGEMKRLSLAVQLLTDPPLLFCDEPTTGLDSYSAGVVVEKLRQFAERGKAVVATIHQPASGLFDLFNNVLLLAGGRVAYFGLVSETSSYFNSVGLVCPPTYNPAEFYVQQLAVLPGKEFESFTRTQWLCDEFQRSERGQELAETVSSESYRRRNTLSTDLLNLEGNWSSYSSSASESLIKEDSDGGRVFNQYMTIQPPSKLTQLNWLLWRSFKDITRNSADQILRFAMFMCTAALVASPYVHITSELSQPTIQNLQGFLHLIITETFFTCSYSVFHTFPAEIPCLLREIGNGLYTPGPYYISKMLVTLPRAVLESFVFATFVFWVVGLRGGVAGYIVFCVPVVFCAVTATAYGSLMSASFESVATASLVSVPIELVGLIFSGVFIQLSNVPSHLSWVKYLSQFYYGQEALSIVQWRQIDSIACEPHLPCLPDGEAVLNKYGYNADHFLVDLLGLTCIYCCAHFVGFLAIWKRSRQQAIY